ncbi:MAG: RNA polymerase sigma factor [Cyclobacteriaceae bacterium]|nr:RNA polymerase sigma factor [Cyclobacteriaceae bacterium]
MKLSILKSNRQTDLISACRRQEAKAQRELYNAYAAQMLGLCRRYVKDELEAEDVMVKGFMKVLTKIDLFEGKGSFEGWMKRIMVNEALGYIRQNKSMYVEVEIEAADREPDFDALSTNLEVEELLAMVNELPVGYRTIFNMYAIEGYSHGEISKMLNISENTSKSQLSRARAQLQKILLEKDKQLEKMKINEDGKQAR